MTEVSTETQEQKYIKFADPTWDPNTDDGKGGKGKGGELIIKMRLLDFPGVGVFRHWIGPGDVKRPYNCPGKLGGCPACKERSVAKLKDPESDWRGIHRMDHRNVVNVLELAEGQAPKLKVFQISNSVEKRLGATIARGAKYADPTDYDIEVMKRRTGSKVFDIEYDVFTSGDVPRKLTAAEKEVAAKKFDLKPETTPVSPEEIGAAIAGTGGKSGPGPASQEQKDEVLKVLKGQGLSLLDVEIADIDNLTAEKAVKVIHELG